jgi:hypothetical protein
MHTNISEANMMVLRTNHAKGILVGFEFALVETWNPEQGWGDVAAHHVATLAIDRCQDEPLVHLLRHELESFGLSLFFILDAFRSGRRIVGTKVEKWYTGDWESIKHHKSTFIAEAKKEHATSASPFAESLGIDPHPLNTFSRALAEMLDERETLDPARMLSILQQARDAYAPSTSTLKI